MYRKAVFLYIIKTICIDSGIMYMQLWFDLELASRD